MPARSGSAYGATMHAHNTFMTHDAACQQCQTTEAARAMGEQLGSGSGMTLFARPMPPIHFRLNHWGDMWHSPPDPIEDFVLMQDPRTKDAWAIISSLKWLLLSTRWYRAGLSSEQLARELRRNSYKVGGSKDMIKKFHKALEVILPDYRARPPPGGWGREVLVSAEVRKEELMDRIAWYEFRSRVRVQVRWVMLRKTGLATHLVVRILRFLEVRIDDLTGPLMYCMRCKEHFNLAALIQHFALSSVHIDAVA